MPQQRMPQQAPGGMNPGVSMGKPPMPRGAIPDPGGMRMPIRASKGASQAPIEQSEEDARIDSIGTTEGLREELEKIKQKMRELKTKKFVSKNRMEKEKQKIVRGVFREMEEAGVDPTSLESIRDFLTRLEKSDPDLMELFEKSIALLEPKEVEGEKEVDGIVPPEQAVPNQAGLGTPISQNPNIGGVANNINEPMAKANEPMQVPRAGDLEGGKIGGTEKYKGIRSQMRR